jgi:hypothetical protein
MKFDALHENLRLEILRRIDRGLLTGSTLARATEFQQAHISNFLNRKRSLSLEGLDRVLTAQNLSIIDLIPADELASVPTHRRNVSLTQTVTVVTHTAASSSARIQPPEIIDTIEVPDSVIHSSRARPIPGRDLWQRFVAVRVDAIQAAAMEPLLRQHFIVVIDRHYNSLAPYRSQPPTVYAVRGSDALYLCFLEFEADRLIVRPRNQQIPVLLIALASNEQPADRIVGRICYVLSEF